MLFEEYDWNIRKAQHVAERLTESAPAPILLPRAGISPPSTARATGSIENSPRNNNPGTTIGLPGKEPRYKRRSEK